MGDITIGDVQEAYQIMMNLVDKAQWKSYRDPISEQEIVITEKSRGNIKISASTAVAQFREKLNKYLDGIGIK